MRWKTANKRAKRKLKRQVKAKSFLKVRMRPHLLSLDRVLKAIADSYITEPDGYIHSSMFPVMPPYVKHTMRTRNWFEEKK